EGSRAQRSLHPPEPLEALPAVLPHGWEDRLIRVENANTGGGAGLCLEVHDLAMSKLIAGREKDLGFVRALLRRRFAEKEVLAERLTRTGLPADLRTLCEGRLKALEYPDVA